MLSGVPWNPDSPELTIEPQTHIVVFEGESPSASLAGLELEHAAFLEKLGGVFGEPVPVIQQYTTALNALALSLTSEQAAFIQTLPEIAEVLPDTVLQLQRNSAEQTEAPSVWSGLNHAGLQATRGEGVLVGIIDSGIDFNNASFAAVSPIGDYTHVNPFGSGNYLGVCDPNHADHDPSFACNDKLVGAYDFTSDTLINSPAFADHGTAVAGIAAGNFVSVPIPGTNDEEVISGVAPHANVIAYDVCDSADGCSGTAIIAAVDQAIADGVHVLNMSIGGDTQSPWTGLMATAMRNAYEAGIFVSVSAGNKGPGASTITAPGDAPWVAAVAAADTADLVFSSISVMGAESIPVDLRQINAVRGANTSIDQPTAELPLIHSANVAPGDSLGSAKYSEGTFAGAIALIDRGNSLFATKVQNAFDAGAEAVIVINNVAGPPVFMAGVDNIPIPSVMVSQTDGTALRNWAEQNPEARVRINADETREAATVADFSSRGGNLQSETLSPAFAAPGNDNVVVAPVATTGVDTWEYFSGTSAAAPHVAGAAALLVALHPNWSPSEIQSALQTTAQSSQIFDGPTRDSAGPFDVGSGTIDVAQAAQAGIVLHESTANFTAANPASGGDPTGLNLAAFVDADFADITSWTRTLKSTQSESIIWTPKFVSDSGVTLTLDRETVTIPAHGTATVTLTATVESTVADWLFGELILTPDVSIPEARFPVAVRPNARPGVFTRETGSGTDVSESGSVDSYELGLRTIPAGAVQLRISAPGDLQVSIDGGPFASTLDLTLNSLDSRTISVRALDDQESEGPHSEFITHSIISSADGNNYPITTQINDVQVSVFDNEFGELSLDASDAAIDEAGETSVATVARGPQSDMGRPLHVALSTPDSVATMDISRTAIDTVTIPAGESTASFLIVGIDNSDIDGDRKAVISAQANGFESATVSIQINDNDSAGIEVFESGGETVVNEDGTDHFDIRLSARPVSDVVLRVMSENSASATVDKQTVVFNPDNWDVRQTIVVTGNDESNVSGERHVPVTIAVVPENSAENFASAVGVEVSVKVLDVRISAPEILNPTGTLTIQNPRFEWTDAAGADSYDFWLQYAGENDDPIVTTNITQTSFTLPTELGIGRYQFWVRAQFAAGESQWIGRAFNVSLNPIVDPLPRFSSDTQPRISWQEVSGASSYDVFLSNRTTDQVAVFEDLDGSQTSIVPNSELQIGLHRVWVRARGPGNFTAKWSEGVDFVVGPDLLSPPTATFELRPTFRWSDIRGAATYQLYVRQPDGAILNVEGLVNTSFTPSSELKTGKHFWWVRPSTADGLLGAWSQRAETFVGGRPNVLMSTDTVDDASPELTWTPVEGAVDYEVYVGNTGQSGSVVHVSGLKNSTFRPPILADGEYTIWVRARAEASTTSSWSAPKKFNVAAVRSDLVAAPVQQLITTFSTTPELSWTADSGADSFDVFLHDGRQNIESFGLTTTSWTTPDLGTGVWTWSVRAVDSAGRGGEWRSAVVDTTGRPVAVSANPFESALNFAWTPVAGADRYLFQVDNLSNGTAAVIRRNDLIANELRIGELPDPGRYRFWVKATRNSAPSEGFWSLPFEFTIP